MTSITSVRLKNKAILEKITVEGEELAMVRLAI
jgi:hypothetical protein